MSAGCIARGSYGSLSDEHRRKVSEALRGQKKPSRTLDHTQNLVKSLTQRYLTLRGRTQSLKDWSVELGFSYFMLHLRLSNGWSVEHALTLPKGARRPK